MYEYLVPSLNSMTITSSSQPTLFIRLEDTGCNIKQSPPSSMDIISYFDEYCKYNERISNADIQR